jgi:hypothetical protein
MKTIWLLVSLLTLSFQCLNAQLTLSLPNDGVISAATEGEATGWGFTLDFSNDPAGDFALITGSDFCTGAQTTPCSNAAGYYTDFMANNFIIVGPAPENSVVSQLFDPLNALGTGSFTITTSVLSAPLIGSIDVTYDLYSSDPFNGGEPISQGLTASASAEIEPVPEPSSWTLIFLGLTIFSATYSNPSKNAHRLFKLD